MSFSFHGMNKKRWNCGMFFFFFFFFDFSFQKNVKFMPILGLFTIIPTIKRYYRVNYNVAQQTTLSILG